MWDSSSQNDITLTGGVWPGPGDYLALNSSLSTSTKLVFDHNQYSADHGIVFEWTGTDITLKCNDVGGGNDDSTNPPVAASLGTGSGTQSSSLTGLSTGNTVSLHGTGTSSFLGYFQIPSFNTTGGGGGPNPLSNSDSDDDGDSTTKRRPRHNFW